MLAYAFWNLSNQILLKNIKPEDYDVQVTEIKKDDLIVRTNHSQYLDDAGYTDKEDRKSVV